MLIAVTVPRTDLAHSSSLVTLLHTVHYTNKHRTTHGANLDICTVIEFSILTIVSSYKVVDYVKILFILYTIRHTQYNEV